MASLDDILTVQKNAVVALNNISQQLSVSGTGTVNSGISGQLAYYSATGSAVSGNSNVTISSAALTLGVTGTATGSLIFSGATSGKVTIKSADTAGSWSLTLPTNSGTNGYVLQTDGSGVTSWTPNTTGGGTVSTGTAGQLAYYSATGSTVSGNPNVTISSAALTLGVAGTATGSLLLSGASSGVVTVKPSSAAGTWSLTLPTSAGTNGYVLQTDGSGVTSWTPNITGSGTVTSVGLSFSTGAANILSNSGAASPITGAGTYTLAVSGTSGGIPYFSSTTAWSSSALLAASALMIGGGPGIAPSTITTGTGVLTALGNSVNSSGGIATSVPYVDVRNFGYVADGSTNNYTAVVNAIASLPTTGGAIYFPPGIGIINSVLTINYPSSGNYALSFIGAGSEVSILQFNGCNGFNVTVNGSKQYIHFSGLTLSTNNSAGTYTGITLTNTVELDFAGQNNLNDITLRGSVIFTNYWGTGISVAGLSNINFDGVDVYGTTAGTVGTGISLYGYPSGALKFGVIYNITKCNLQNIGVGLYYGTDVQGVTVTQTNIVNGGTGIKVGTDATGETQLLVSGCNFNTQYNQIEIDHQVATTQIIGNSFYIASGYYGVLFNTTSSSSYGNIVADNSFYALTAFAGTGVSIKASNWVGVYGNYFGFLATGVDLVGTSTANVQSNQYNGNTVTVANIGSNSVGVATQ